MTPFPKKTPAHSGPGQFRTLSMPPITAREG